ncbi:MAG: pyridoxal phosphate-dependent aminotransferase [Desulfarculaceae bacterium]|nr:pyridoxal phosphate-dependent aminotransferase [Desulfarculaceae bacterium]MCF8072513.1 pyridoxal phosphate-dependent aminotransferase [Desulfarculaceae bacterium]MCF8103654.1 pyridoxal phosphate-dependent aminotransferase [Desulfarculaceae bacterium]MCF8117054.1 pyridoxal phosphate-dependent aminotransferase [Desulfarculaceae bacterium]
MGVTERASKIPAFIVMDVLERAQELTAQGREIIHLEVGEPDFATPEVITQAAVRALADGQTHYTHSLGVMELREAVSRHYARRYGVEVDPARVLVTAGTSTAMLLLFSALLETGQEIIISDPHYACYDNFISFVGGVPVRVPVRAEEGFQFRPAEIGAALSPLTKGIFINSPSNPTGQVMTPEIMAAIAELAPGKPGGPYVISDEIYHGLIYEGQQEHSILEYTDNAFVLDGFSKRYAMCGWRLGYVIAPANYVRPLQKMHQNFAICAPSVSQWAGVAALEDAWPEVERMRAVYDTRRRRLIEGLKELGFAIPVEPKGAFYIFTSCAHLDPDDYKLAFDILERTGVAVAPGRDFGPGGHGFLRFSYCNSLENIETALERLGAYLAEHYPGATG